MKTTRQIITGIKVRLTQLSLIDPPSPFIYSSRERADEIKTLLDWIVKPKRTRKKRD